MTDPLDPHHNALPRGHRHGDEADDDRAFDEFADQCAENGIHYADPQARAKLAAAKMEKET